MIPSGDRELVASDPCHHVVLANHVPYAAGHDAQHLITDRVAMAVVDRLECIQVEVEEGKVTLLVAPSGVACVEQAVQAVAIRQSGQCIGIGTTTQLLDLQLL